MSKAVSDQVYTRALVDEVTVREINEEKRTAVFVAATETGVRTWNGKEYLRVKGMDLKRYKKNPVVLDTHNRWEAGAVIGKAEVKVEGRELIATVCFAETLRAEEIWKLVKGGFLRALSVGFIALKAFDLDEGDTDGKGEDMVCGPGRVISQSELFEISVVPVPADPEALRRMFLEEYAMSKKEQTDDPTPAPTKATPPATVETQRQQPADELPEERALRIEKAKVEHIRMICPRGIEQVADLCIAEGLSLEESRKRMQDAQKERAKPVGTPEPEQLKTDEQDAAPEVSDDVLIRSLGGPSL